MMGTVVFVLIRKKPESINHLTKHLSKPLKVKKEVALAGLLSAPSGICNPGIIWKLLQCHKTDEEADQLR